MFLSGFCCHFYYIDLGPRHPEVSNFVNALNFFSGLITVKITQMI